MSMFLGGGNKPENSEKPTQIREERMKVHEDSDMGSGLNWDSNTVNIAS